MPSGRILHLNPTTPAQALVSSPINWVTTAGVAEKRKQGEATPGPGTGHSTVTLCAIGMPPGLPGATDRTRGPRHGAAAAAGPRPGRRDWPRALCWALPHSGQNRPPPSAAVDGAGTWWAAALRPEGSRWLGPWWGTGPPKAAWRGLFGRAALHPAGIWGTWASPCCPQILERPDVPTGPASPPTAGDR